MPVVVLDTDAVSLLHRRQLDVAYAQHLIGNTAAITFVTLGELYKGMETRSWGERRRNDPAAWVDRLLVLPYSNEGRTHMGPARGSGATTWSPAARSMTPGSRRVASPTTCRCSRSTIGTWRTSLVTTAWGCSRVCRLFALK